FHSQTHNPDESWHDPPAPPCPVSDEYPPPTAGPGPGRSPPTCKPQRRSRRTCEKLWRTSTISSVSVKARPADGAGRGGWRNNGYAPPQDKGFPSRDSRRSELVCYRPAVAICE